MIADERDKQTCPRCKQKDNLYYEKGGLLCKECLNKNRNKINSNDLEYRKQLRLHKLGQ